MNEYFAVGGEKDTVDAFEVRVSRRNTDFHESFAIPKQSLSQVRYVFGERQ